MQAGIGGSLFAFHQMSDWLSLGAAAFAFLCLLTNGILLRRHAAERLARVNADREASMLRWSDEAIAALAESERLCVEKDDIFKPEEFRRRQSETASLLSMLLDRGQLFFPNVDTERYANRRASGQSPKLDAMEALFQAYLTLRNVEANDKGPAMGAAAQRLFEFRKLFVDEVFGGVSPRRRQAAMSGPEARKADRAHQTRRRTETRQTPAAAA
jgi:hypothetical protein